MLRVGLILLQMLAPAGRLARPPQTGGLPHGTVWEHIGETPDERVNPQPMIAPGKPPVLSFRYYEGTLHHRFGNSELLLDDAGH